MNITRRNALCSIVVPFLPLGSNLPYKVITINIKKENIQFNTNKLSTVLYDGMLQYYITLTDNLDKNAEKITYETFRRNNKEVKESEIYVYRISYSSKRNMLKVFNILVTTNPNFTQREV